MDFRNQKIFCMRYSLIFRSSRNEKKNLKSCFKFILDSDGKFLGLPSRLFLSEKQNNSPSNPLVPIKKLSVKHILIFCLENSPLLWSIKQIQYILLIYHINSIKQTYILKLYVKFISRWTFIDSK